MKQYAICDPTKVTKVWRTNNIVFHNERILLYMDQYERFYCAHPVSWTYISNNHRVYLPANSYLFGPIYKNIVKKCSEEEAKKFIEEHIIEFL